MPNNSGPMACPVDGATLVMSERSGIEIDYCPTCRGVWLDRGELDKIIERSAAPVAAAPPPQPAPRHQRETYRDYDDGRHQGHHGHRGYPKRRKSFLEEL